MAALKPSTVLFFVYDYYRRGDKASEWLKNQFEGKEVVIYPKKTIKEIVYIIVKFDPSYNVYIKQGLTPENIGNLLDYFWSKNDYSRFEKASSENTLIAPETQKELEVLDQEKDEVKKEQKTDSLVSQVTGSFELTSLKPSKTPETPKLPPITHISPIPQIPLKPRLPGFLKEPLKKIASSFLSMVKIQIIRHPMLLSSFFTGLLGGVLGSSQGPFAALGGFIAGFSTPTIITKAFGAQTPASRVSAPGDPGITRIKIPAALLRGVGAGASAGARVLLLNPWVLGGIVLVILILVLISLGLLKTNSLFPPHEGLPAGTTATGQCPTKTELDINRKSTPETCKYFNPSINIFSTNISQQSIDLYVEKYSGIFIGAGLGDLSEFKRIVNYIITSAQSVGLNPVIFLGYWKSESAFSTVLNAAALGCAPGQGVKSFETEVNCAVGLSADGSSRGGAIVSRCASPNNPDRSAACDELKSIRDNRPDIYSQYPIKYPVSTFDDFAESYGSKSPALAQSEGVVQNNNCISTYNTLLEVFNAVRACVPQGVPTGFGALGFSVTCPLDPLNNSNFKIECGTAEYPVPGVCGHGHPTLYRACTRPPYAVCPFSPGLKKAVDVILESGTTANALVYLPFINGNQSVDWKLTESTIIPDGRGGNWGYKMIFDGNYNGRALKLDLTHLNESSPITIPDSSGFIPSGKKIATIVPAMNHLHTAISVDGSWVEAEKEIFMCSHDTPVVVGE